jgi:hypothetical protein
LFHQAVRIDAIALPLMPSHLFQFSKSRYE